MLRPGDSPRTLAKSVVYLDSWANPVLPSLLQNVGSLLNRGMFSLV